MCGILVEKLIPVFDPGEVFKDYWNCIKVQLLSTDLEGMDAIFAAIFENRKIKGKQRKHILQVDTAYENCIYYAVFEQVVLCLLRICNFLLLS